MMYHTIDISDEEYDRLMARRRASPCLLCDGDGDEPLESRFIDDGAFLVQWRKCFGGVFEKVTHLESSPHQSFERRLELCPVCGKTSERIRKESIEKSRKQAREAEVNEQ